MEVWGLRCLQAARQWQAVQPSLHLRLRLLQASTLFQSPLQAHLLLEVRELAETRTFCNQRLGLRCAWSAAALLRVLACSAAAVQRADSSPVQRATRRSFQPPPPSLTRPPPCSERQLATVTWPEVARRLAASQQRRRLCVARELSEHDIVARVMRRENYLIGMLNQVGAWLGLAAGDVLLPAGACCCLVMRLGALP